MTVLLSSITQLGGIFASAVRPLGPGHPPAAFLMTIFALIFATVVIGIGCLVVFSLRLRRRLKKLQQDNPGKPWLWREDWAKGRCNSRTESDLVRAWTFAIFWNLVSAPLLFTVPKAVQRQPGAMLGFLFPAIGIGLLVWAIRETLARFEFGATWFEMSGSPLVIGREFQGNIHARFPHAADHGVRLKLSCVNRVVTGSGKSQNTTEKILWREETNLTSAELAPGPLGTMIPVRFRIPWNALPSDDQNPRNSILWLLEADADVPGVDYKDVFELPVFRTKDTPSTPEPASEQNSACKPPLRPTILVNQTGEGTEFYFPAARNRGYAMGLSAVTLLWSGILAAIVSLHAPLIFPVVFGFFDLLLLTGAAQVWLGTSRVIVDASRIRIQMGLLGGGKWREFSKAQVLDIQAVIAAQQGGGTGTPYYDIRLLQTDHPDVTLGRMIRDKEEAEWIVLQMRKALGMEKALAARAF